MANDLSEFGDRLQAADGKWQKLPFTPVPPRLGQQDRQVHGDGPPKLRSRDIAPKHSFFIPRLLGQQAAIWLPIRTVDPVPDPRFRRQNDFKPQPSQSKRKIDILKVAAEGFREGIDGQ